MLLEFVSFTPETREELQKIWDRSYPEEETAANVAFGIACDNFVFGSLWIALEEAKPQHAREYIFNSQGAALEPVFIASTSIHNNTHPQLNRETQLIVFLQPEEATQTEFMRATRKRLNRAQQLLEDSPTIPRLPERYADFTSRAIRL